MRKRDPSSSDRAGLPSSLQLRRDKMPRLKMRKTKREMRNLKELTNSKTKGETANGNLKTDGCPHDFHHPGSV